ncbi:MerR family transcriptional regulator [Aneurinibacillus thermoaerophilus]|uniref:MerR family transcriptional regulator n=1 Tax=Aneurinibacillus thermoaerophilus TaxID=143495 RepID=A0ABX8YE19_ANETH|nr:MerR family transcriptional regulator [Aneurinibacillus thermoaerophilus]QYY43736.1 MerR family transcriptional regulator [Aneurinibacillus thermoaerophilus]
MQSNSMWMASKDVAEKLDVNVRTVRNWIDTFSSYMVLQKNSQGHFLLSEQAFNLLVEIKRVKDSGVQTLKEVEEVLLLEKILPEKKNLDINYKFQEETEPMSPPEDNTTRCLFERMNELERHLSQQLLETMQEFMQAYEASVSYQPKEETPPADLMLTQYYKEILRKMEEMEKKQESLRLEIRKINFEIQMLGAVQKQQTKKKKGFSWNFFCFSSKKKAKSQVPSKA